ncbi:WG repeat-containing protein [Paenibacillus hexagrammi]|uniref:WG repeat-containing protein n=1 Tax=Paenibacillus hexagrammi TaxID=2908839 RepID=A0ABY3SFG1_9BACL|nr:WG repeat-containing protein [Paenibacillus sp. YPD9-1]UJF32753.1 WG repeat-containing protein [Paenibacillus sp. YPD9-1]
MKGIRSKGRTHIALGAAMLLLLPICLAAEPLAAQENGAPDAAANVQTSATPEQPIEDLYPYYSMAKGKKWGYLNREGKTIIEPQFDSAESFQEQGVAVVGVEDSSDGYFESKYGLIDRSGSFVVPAEYEYIQEFGSGFAAEDFEHHSLILDGHGNKVNEMAGDLGSLSEGLATFYKDEKYGYVDGSGSIIVSPQYESANDFKNGKAVVKTQDGQYSIINTKGETLRSYEAEYMGDSFSYGLSEVKKSDDSLWGYLGENGNMMIPETYEIAEPFQEGRAVVKLKSFGAETGLINTKGEYVLEPHYAIIQYVGESMWAVARKDRYFPDGESKDDLYKFALFNKDGKQITDYLYDDVASFKDGYSVVSQGLTSFFIDKTGQKAQSLPIIQGTGTIQRDKGLISANVDNRLQYIDMDGNVIWKAEYLKDLGNGIVLKEAKERPHRNTLIYYPVIEGIQDKQVSEKINAELMPSDATISSEDQSASYDEDFTVHMFKKDLLVVGANGYYYPFGAAHGMPSQVYKHVNIRNGSIYKLADLFKQDSGYLSRISDLIREQLKDHAEEKGVFPQAAEDLPDITDSQGFYLDSDVLNIYYNPYDIGPYAAGFITFQIPLSDLDTYIDKQGEFWKSFHE